MASIIEFYHKGNSRALDTWNGGEGHFTTTCRGKVGLPSPCVVPCALRLLFFCVRSA